MQPSDIALDENWRVFQGTADLHQSLELHPAERAMLELYRGHWFEIEMLDLGVGTGRTAYTFAAIAKGYVGLDYAPSMIRLCRENIGENERVRFVVGDVRALEAAVGTRKFDFILFSNNGLDYIGHGDRIDALRGIRRHLNGGGRLLFSSHSLNDYPFRWKPPPLCRGRPVLSIYRLITSIIGQSRLRWHHRKADIPAMRNRRWAMIRDGAANFRLTTYYVDPLYQIEQLAETGFHVEAVIDEKGRGVAHRGAPIYGCPHFLCSPAPQSS